MTIKAFFLPTECKLCYWGRMAIAVAIGVGVGVFTQSYWSLVLPCLVATLAVTAKWLVTKYN